MDELSVTPVQQLDHCAHHTNDQQYPLCFLGHDIDITMNIGSLFRLADALGVEKIYLTGNSITPPNDKIKRTSRSTEKSVPFEYFQKPADVIKKLKHDNYKIISLEITSTSIDLSELTLNRDEKICLIIGAENKGINEQLLAVSDLTVCIPMLGKNSSMNVANACAIATYAITQQLQIKGI